MNQIEHQKDNEWPTRSRFLSTVAIVFIVLSGIKSCGSTFGTVSYFTVNNELYARLAESSDTSSGIYKTFGPVLANVWILFVTDWLFSISMLIGAIGTFNRKNWARILFATTLVISILYFISVPILLHVVITNDWLLQDEQSQQRYWNIQLVIIPVVLCFSGLLVWIIKRLFSPNILSEFKTNKLAG